MSSNWLKPVIAIVSGVLIGGLSIYFYPKIAQQSDSRNQVIQLTKEKEQLTKEKEILSKEKEQLTIEKEQRSLAMAELKNKNEKISKDNDDKSTRLLSAQHKNVDKDKTISEHKQLMDALAELVKVDNAIISGYKTVLSGIMVATISDKESDKKIALAATKRALNELEVMESRRNAMIGRN